MILETYSHNLGVNAVDDRELNNIRNIIGAIDINIEKGSAPKLRKLITEEVQKYGWSGKVKVDTTKEITIPSMKKEISLCIQTGNISRFYSDILKLETLYKNNKTTCGIYIVLKNEAAKRAGNNIANYERVISELELYRHTITIPIVVIGIE